MQLPHPELLRDRAFIDGQWCHADNGATVTITNPATDETLASVPDSQVSKMRMLFLAGIFASQPWIRSWPIARSANDLSFWYQVPAGRKHVFTVW